MPEQADNFFVEIIPGEFSHDVFEIVSIAGKISLRGNNPVSIASALNLYLKEFCRCEYSWCGSQMNLPLHLPVVLSKVRRATLHRYRTFFNYCTFGYVMPWWHWPEWERAIDWLALNGYNLPLAATGFDGVWYHTLLRFGFTDLEARSFLCGPAHLPWLLMQNLEGFQGPLPKDWIERHIELGRRIIHREVELGMMPIQQGFSGHVPHLLKQKFPAAAITTQSSWCGFPGVAQLDPLDPLFAKFGVAFIEEEIKLFGAQHFYAADPFHECWAARPSDDDVAKVGRGVFDVMQAADPAAIWVTQEQHRPLMFKAVPEDRLLVYTQADYAFPYLLIGFNNFGCRNNLHGDLRKFAANPFAKVAQAPDSKSRGTGLVMEGMIQNPVYNQLLGDLIWRSEPVNPTEWLHDYAERRYGAASAAANQAWDILLDGPYRPDTPEVEYSSMIAARPALAVTKSGPNLGFGIPYDPLQLVKAWELLLADAGKLSGADAYRFDVMDITRQVLSNLAQLLQQEVRWAFFDCDVSAFQQSTGNFEALLADLEILLATRREYHFGKWVAAARTWGETGAAKQYYERSASTLVTYWGPDDDCQIFDYAWREWAGLVGNFYLPRWQMFHRHLADCLARGVTYADPAKSMFGREAFRADAFYSQLADWEIAWTKKEKNLPAEPAGDTISIAQKLFAKYRPIIDRASHNAARLCARALELQAKDTGNLGEAIGKWPVATDSQVLDFDITQFMEGEGTYQISFIGDSGILEIFWSAILVNGVEAARDKHHGVVAATSENHTYRICLTTLPFGGAYNLQVKVYAHAGTNSSGVVFMRKID